MNERIKELALQACIHVLTTKGMEDIVDGCYVVSPDKLDKFAELIVQECMDVAKYHTPNTEECEYTWLIKDKIKEHFGVE